MPRYIGHKQPQQTILTTLENSPTAESVAKGGETLNQLL